MIKTCPDTSILFVVPDVRQAEEAYLEMSCLIEEEDLSIWTGGHDAKSSLAMISDSHQGFQPMAPRMSKADLKARRVAIISHAWYIEHGGQHPCMQFCTEQRTLHILDERLSEVNLLSIELEQISAAREMVSQVGVSTTAPLSTASVAALAHLELTATLALAVIEGPLYVPMGDAGTDSPLSWFATQEAKYLEAHSISPLSDVVSFGRSLVAGHAFFARFPKALRKEGAVDSAEAVEGGGVSSSATPSTSRSSVGRSCSMLALI
jgi:hypothetical protein